MNSKYFSYIELKSYDYVMVPVYDYRDTKEKCELDRKAESINLWNIAKKEIGWQSHNKYENSKKAIKEKIAIKNLNKNYKLSIWRNYMSKVKVIFHAKLHKDDTTPDHTLVFLKNKDDSLCLGYSRPRPKTPDAFNRKFGLEQAEERAEILQMRDSILVAENKKPRNIHKIEQSSLKNILPKTVLSVLPFYVNKAKELFDIKETATIIVRGDKRSNRIFEFQM